MFFCKIRSGLEENSTHLLKKLGNSILGFRDGKSQEA